MRAGVSTIYSGTRHIMTSTITKFPTHFHDSIMSDENVPQSPGCAKCREDVLNRIHVFERDCRDIISKLETEHSNDLREIANAFEDKIRKVEREFDSKLNNGNDRFSMLEKEVRELRMIIGNEESALGLFGAFKRMEAAQLSLSTDTKESINKLLATVSGLNQALGNIADKQITMETARAIVDAKKDNTVKIIKLVWTVATNASFIAVAGWFIKLYFFTNKVP